MCRQCGPFNGWSQALTGLMEGNSHSAALTDVGHQEPVGSRRRTCRRNAERWGRSFLPIQRPAVPSQSLRVGPFEEHEGSRQSLFLEVDQPALRPPPAGRLDLSVWSQATVNVDFDCASADIASMALCHRDSRLYDNPLTAKIQPISRGTGCSPDRNRRALPGTPVK